MITISLSTLLLVNYINGNPLSPGCNYAATGVHFYPIGACDTTKTVSGDVTTYSAFQYVCRGGNTVYKLEYSGSDYCDGAVQTSTKVTDLEGMECDSQICSYADGCSTTGCVTEMNGNYDCSECEANPNDYNKHCTPFITDHCMGNVGELLKQDTCSGAVLTENFYFGDGCSNDNFIFDIVSGGSGTSTNCIDNAFKEISCNSAVLTPSCNYAATGTHFYPIGGCDKTKTVDDVSGDITYFGFEYVCNGEDVYRNEYDTDEYCDGSAVSSVIQNNILRHFECDLTDCQYADGCSKTGCVEDGDCRKCEKGEKNKNKNDYNRHCLPIITGQCIGNKGGLLVDAVCDNNKKNKDLLTENFYFGDDCSNSVFSEQSGSNDENINCQNNAFTTVNCLPSKKGGKGAKGAKAAGSKVSVNQIVSEHNNDNKGADYVLFGYSLNLMDLALFAIVILGLIVLTMYIKYVLCGNNNKSYSKTQSYDDSEDQENKSLF